MTLVAGISRSLWAFDGPSSLTPADDREFEDDASLLVPTTAEAMSSSDSFVFFGIRGSSARLKLESQQKSGASAVLMLSGHVRRRSFEKRSLSWSHSDEYGWGVALGFGYGIAAAYEAGALITTDVRGSGVFLHIGGEADLRSAEQLPFGRAFAHVPIGYHHQLEGSQIEAAILPSLGEIAIAEPDRHLSGPFWLRERLRIHWWHVQLDVEHGRSDWTMTARDFRGELCAAAGRQPPISSCVSVETFERTSIPHASFSEIALTLGIGNFWTSSEHRTSPDPLKLR